MIPAAAYTPLLRMLFGMAAMRKGSHWQLQVQGGMDEGDILAEALAGVMKYVPIPAKEMGILSDLTTCAMAFYASLAPRLAIDNGAAPQGAALPRTAPRPPQPAGGPPAAVPDPQERREPTAAELMDALPSEPLAAAPVVQLVTPQLNPGEDPEPALFQAVRPGQQAATVEQLVQLGAADGMTVLDRLAPVPTVDGHPVRTELA